VSTIFLCLAIVASSQLLIAFFAWLAARWFKIPTVGYGRALAAAMVLLAVALSLRLLFAYLEALVDIPSVLDTLLEGFASVVVAWLVIKWMFRTTLAKAILTWVSMLVACAINLGMFFLVVRPFVLEAFIIPTNAMAPTLLGPHRVGVCPYCGQSMIVPDFSEEPGRRNALEQLSICSSCFRTATIQAFDREPNPGDRIFVNKLLTARRWDSVEFRWSENPTVQYVKRLVGLPGEEVVIKEGAIWINGRKIEPPKEIARLQIATAPEGYLGQTWGSPERPARLGADDYFVVGDFAQQSADSRTWHRASGSHQPFAVLGSQIDGVATVIYWPPRRWRILR
jgi:signal peptidase I